jgi:hypothetical protein
VSNQAVGYNEIRQAAATAAVCEDDKIDSQNEPDTRKINGCIKMMRELNIIIQATAYSESW